MGGSTKQEQVQQQTTSPWAPAAGSLQGILGQVNAINSGLTPAENSAITGLSANGGFLNQFTPQATSIANNMLAGGGATANAPMINDAYSQYRKVLDPYASGANLNPYSTPGFSDAMSTLNSDITNQVNGRFAAAGRDMSGMNSQALARGLSQGEGGLIQSQYNTNVGNQLNAAGNEYGAGTNTAGLLSSLNQQGLANQQTGLGAAGTAADFSNSPYMQQMAAEAQRRGIPLQTLAAQMGMVLPAAQAFMSQSGTGTTTTSVPLSQQIIGGVVGGAGLLGGTGAFGQNGWLKFGSTPAKATP